jgi:hypothetical protein
MHIILYTIYFHRFFSCPRLDKVGGLGDGPKWTCDIDRVGIQAARRKREDPDPAPAPDKKHCLMYSVGSNGDYQWEDAVQETLQETGGCEIHIFDPGNFDRGVNNTNQNMIYHKWGLKSSYEEASNNLVTKRGKNMEVYSFPEILKKLGHEDRTIDVLKIDCEGCEWYVFMCQSCRRVVGVEALLLKAQKGTRAMIPSLLTLSSPFLFTRIPFQDNLQGLDQYRYSSDSH